MFLKCLDLSGWKHTSWSKRQRQRQKQYPTIIEELCHQFTLAEIRKSTKNFDGSRLIEERGLGIKVYKGILLQYSDASDYTVTVKRFNAEGSELFNNEIELLCQLRHPNCVSLIGFCNHEKDKILVYEYMSNGSLRQHLRGEDRGTLSWKKRVEICIGAARGLHYLHTGTKRSIFHRNITSNSILLDAHMEPRLAAFSISIQGPRFMSNPKPIKVDVIAGTFGYMAMEHLKDGIITDKCDVYSFGVVLLEVVCGRNYLIMLSEGVNFLEKPVEENIDPIIRGNIAPECWQVFIDITVRCLKLEPDERPTIGEVEVELEHALSLQEKADFRHTDGHYTLLSKTIINLGPE